MPSNKPQENKVTESEVVQAAEEILVDETAVEDEKPSVSLKDRILQHKQTIGYVAGSMLALAITAVVAKKRFSSLSERLEEGYVDGPVVEDDEEA